MAVACLLGNLKFGFASWRLRICPTRCCCNIVVLQAAATSGVRGVAANVTRIGTRLERGLEVCAGLHAIYKLQSCPAPSPSDCMHPASFLRDVPYLICFVIWGGVILALLVSGLLTGLQTTQTLEHYVMYICRHRCLIWYLL